MARRYQPLLVNTVVGFIGPEYLYDGKQIIRAGLEDHFAASCWGCRWACDVCYTNHAEADQDDMDVLLTLLAASGVQLRDGRAGRGRHHAQLPEHLVSRRLVCARAADRPPAPEFAAWLESVGLTARGKLSLPGAGTPLREALGSLGAG